MNTHAPARIDHIGLNLPERSFGFWEAMLRHLGFQILPDGTHFDAVADPASPMICVTATKPPFGTGYHRKDTGLGHLAFRVESRDAVDAFVTEFLAPHGIKALYGGAREYDYTPGYFAVYAEDENRIKFEVMTSDLVHETAPTVFERADGRIQHETASVFVVRYAEGVWLLLLIMHVRLGALTIPGGHIEKQAKGQGETAAEAAVREVREESGQEIILLTPPSPRMPEGFPHVVLPAPWLIVSGRANPDGMSREPHVHIDHQFLALATENAHPDRECEPQWLSAAEIEGREDILPDTRMQALVILTALERIGVPLEPDALARVLHDAMTGA